MRNKTSTKVHVWLLLLATFIVSCAKDADKHYDVPDWVQGSVWEILETNQENSYSQFLKGVELTGFRAYLEGKGLLTVMAPDDAAFEIYLKEKGYTDVEQMYQQDPAELKKLIGFHLLYYGYNKQMMRNYRPEGQIGMPEELEAITAGMFYKFRTRSTNVISEHIDPLTGREVSVYHLERFMPVFSKEFFSRKKISPASNYSFFYPESTWTGDDGFNVSNASVNTYEIVANNGYIYTVDRVIEPLETIYEEMKKDPNYSTFLKLYDSYSFYEYDPNLSIEYGASVQKDSLFLHKHLDLPPIALEWPTSVFSDLGTLASISYSVFAPSNRAINNFFDSYWKNSGYSNLQELDPLILSTFLSEYVYGGSVVFPEEIASGNIVSSLGTVYNFDPMSASVRKMCVNGAFYGLDEIEGPQVFNTVTGPAFQNKKYLSFLYAMQSSGQLIALSAPLKYTLLMPSDAAFIEQGYTLEASDVGNFLAEENVDGEKEAVAGTTLANIVNAHTAVGEFEINAGGTQVIPTIMPYNYLYVKNGTITSSNNFNRILEPSGVSPFVPFQEMTNHGSPWTNGKVYNYGESQGLFTSIFEADGLKKVLANNNDNRYPYFAFAQLLRKAGLVSGDEILGISGRFVAFIPTNEVIYEALANNQIPGISDGVLNSDGTWAGTFDTNHLKDYLYQYFVSASQETSVPYPGSEMKSGDYFTYAGTYLSYTDTQSALSVKLRGSAKSCAVIPDYDYFPFAFSDGSFHFIDAIL